MIIPGILQENADKIENDLNKIKDFTHLAQIDFADGKLVEGKSCLDLNQIMQIRDPIQYDIHLMVKDPFSYLEPYYPKIEKICTQAEAPVNLASWIEEARQKGYETGLSLNPETSWTKIEKLVPYIDFVQFMTVEPGKQGNSFQPQVLKSIKSFRKKYPNKTIQADGGISKQNIEDVLKAGVNNVVIGSAIVMAEDPKRAYEEFVKAEKQYEKRN